MNVLVDMNLSPSWVGFLQQAGHTAVHWSSVGAPTARDREILRWAKSRAWIVFTHDLDFGAILAATDADAPSVIQIRSADPTPATCGEAVTAVLRQSADALLAGALVSIDQDRARVRLLPLL